MIFAALCLADYIPGNGRRILQSCLRSTADVANSSALLWESWRPQCMMIGFLAGWTPLITRPLLDRVLPNCSALLRRLLNSKLVMDPCRILFSMDFHDRYSCAALKVI